MSLIFSLFLSLQLWAQDSSCKENLKQQRWPVDCFILTKTSVFSSAITKDHLNQWCKTHRESLISKEAPSFLDRLRVPEHCQIALLASRRYYKARQLIKNKEP